MSRPNTTWAARYADPTTEWDFRPVLNAADPDERLARDWNIERLVWRNIEDWTDFNIEDME